VSIVIADAQQVSATTSSAGYITGVLDADVDLLMVSVNNPQSGSTPGGLIGASVVQTSARGYQVRVFALATAPDAGSVQIVKSTQVTVTILGLKVV
jgi:hypothetical protein